MNDESGLIEWWREVRGHPHYEVSNTGYVRNKKTKRMLKQSLNKPDGYYRVSMEGRHYYVHRIVADTYYAGDHRNMDVNHIDGNKTNNELPNLEWLTRKENIQHAWIHGLAFPHSVKVVRCKHCMHRGESRFCEGRPDEFYCADGERGNPEYY